MTRDVSTSKLIMTALMMAIITIATMIFKIPIPVGYINLGDGMIFLAVMLLGKRYGCIAAGFGAALGDIIGGYAVWAPWTFGIKLLMALIFASFLSAIVNSDHSHKSLFGLPLLELTGMLLAGIEMTAGYYVAEGFIYGNWVAPVIGIPLNIVQFIVGIIIAIFLTTALYKTPAGKYFYYKRPSLK